MEWKDLKYWNSREYNNVCVRLASDYNASSDGFHTVCPHIKYQMRCFVETPFDAVKVVILGQDPYHTVGVADGLAFSSGKPDYIPPSLQNIFKELENDLGIKNTTASLAYWARQGVLLLNTCLTVLAGKPNSHQGIGWEPLIEEILEELSTKKRNLVFMLWGKHAQRYEPFIKNVSDHCVVRRSHPSPYSANSGFLGTKPFSECNHYLEQHGVQPIDWRLPDVLRRDDADTRGERFSDVYDPPLR